MIRDTAAGRASPESARDRAVRRGRARAMDGASSTPACILAPVTCAGIEKTLSQYFACKDQDVVAVYLYGSVARGMHGPASDVDVAILLEEPPPATLEGLPLDMEAELERLIRRPVSIVVLNNAPPDLVHRILRDGKLLLDRDPSRRIRFEVKARNEYFDLLPHLKRYRGQP